MNFLPSTPPALVLPLARSYKEPTAVLLKTDWAKFSSDLTYCLEVVINWSAVLGSKVLNILGSEKRSAILCPILEEAPFNKPKPFLAIPFPILEENPNIPFVKAKSLSAITFPVL